MRAEHAAAFERHLHAQKIDFMLFTRVTRTHQAVRTERQYFEMTKNGFTTHPLSRPKRPQPFSEALFREPTSEYRGAPFWSWNTRLDVVQLTRQIEQLKEMGMGGFFMHTRTGLATPYLGEAFMEAVEVCVNEAEAKGMFAYLYDEDRWPSGFAGGLVTEEPQYRAKHLLITPYPYGSGTTTPPLISNAKGGRFENGVLLSHYAVTLTEGRLTRYRRLQANEALTDGETHIYAYLESAEPSPWWNNQTYVDTLSPEAVTRFVAVTHERYQKRIGTHFGQRVPAIFTDEPQFIHVGRLTDDEAILPWTTDFADSYGAAYGEDLLSRLPEVLWNLPKDAVSTARYRYFDHLTERFAAAFADTLGGWCGAHGLELTGHLMEEPTLGSQSAAVGEAMRHYRAFQLPGIDMLCDAMELNTAKQAQSAARQYGRRGVVSELYGVTNWDFDFAGHKRQGDWQAALGVTLRAHHLTWVSMAGEAKRDYPASIGPQSPWWREYGVVEDHFARLNTVLTRGVPVVRLGVLHPIESYWLHAEPFGQNSAAQEKLEKNFHDLTAWLLFDLLDFDLIAESLLPDLCTAGGAPLQVGAMRYDAVIVPPLHTLRSSTLERLEAFEADGGRLIFLGAVPTCVDAAPSNQAAGLAQRTTRLPMERSALLETLEPLRELDLRHPDGRRTETVLATLREGADGRYLFLCNTSRDEGLEGVQLTLRGRWQVTTLDSLDGAIIPTAAEIGKENTTFTLDLPAHGSLLLRLEPSAKSLGRAYRAPRWLEVARLEDPVSVTLNEPNVLLLDRAEYRLGDEAWHPSEEILRLDNTLRARLGWPLRMDAYAQPWIDRDQRQPSHLLHLRFTVVSDIAVAASQLAFEGAKGTQLFWNGLPVGAPFDGQGTGFFVDEAIRTVTLPPFGPGRHELRLSLPYGPRTDLEWCYLLGDFGVAVAGADARITAPIHELSFGDITPQGLPFYTGNVTYHTTIQGNGDVLTLHIPDFRAPLLTAALDSSQVGYVAFAPFRLPLGVMGSGSHQLSLTAFGNRLNAFGSVHNANPNERWFGPSAWRTEGKFWSDAYELKPSGILTSPRLLIDKGLY